MSPPWPKLLHFQWLIVLGIGVQADLAIDPTLQAPPRRGARVVVDDGESRAGIPRARSATPPRCREAIPSRSPTQWEWAAGKTRQAPVNGRDATGCNVALNAQVTVYAIWRDEDTSGGAILGAGYETGACLSGVLPVPGTC
jgi:hypothetical protein